MKRGNPEPRSRIRRVVSRLLAIALGVALAEGGYRTYLCVRHRPHDSSAVRELLLDYAAEGGGLVDDDPRRQWRQMGMTIHPYIGFATDRHQRRIRRLVDEAEAAPDTFYVVAFGGSVALSCFRGQGVFFEEKLEAHPFFQGRDVRLCTLALASHKQPQQLIQLVYLHALGFVPDAVINLDGFNELAVAGGNISVGANPVFPSFGEYAHLAIASSREQESLEIVARILADERILASGAQTALQLGIHHSSLASAIALPALHQSAAAVSRGFEEYEALLARPAAIAGSAGNIERYAFDLATVTGPVPRGGYPTPLERLVDVWANGSLDMKAVADSLGTYYLHVLQPTLHDEGSKPLTPKEIETGATTSVWQTTAARGYPMLRERGKRLSEQGVHFYDASYIFANVEETLYYDACHFVEDGQRILVDAIADELLRGLAARERGSVSTVEASSAEPR